MPKKSDYDAERLRHVLQAQHQVVTRVQALACGMPQSTLDRYIAPGGRWQRLLPGVPMLGLCTFGEQGHIPGLGNVHQDLSLSLTLFA